METRKFEITGMSCAACVAAVERAARAVAGVDSVSVNLVTGSMVLSSEGSLPDDGAVIEAIKAAGYSAAPLKSGGTAAFGAAKPAHDNTKAPRRRFLLSLVLLLPLMYVSMGTMVGLPPLPFFGDHMTASALLQLLLAAPVVLINRTYFTSGLPKLVRGEPNMDSLISVGVIASLLYSAYACAKIGYGGVASLYFDSAAMILTLVSLGKWLEKRSFEKTGKAVRDLVALVPDFASVIRDGKEITVPVSDIRIGETVIVLPGKSIPADGTALCPATVDESAMTGESMPREVSENETVRAGTINLVGTLRLRAEHVSDDTTLSKMIRLVEDTAAGKAPAQRLADKISGYFVPVILVIALVTAVVWLFASRSFENALERGISVLVIACPCSLGLATPVAIIAATGRGARFGILFRNAEALENLHKTKTVIFDKTGTLTEGKPEVTDVISFDGDEERLVFLAASLEKQSSHPIAFAVIEYAQKNGITAGELGNVITMPGYGIVCSDAGIDCSCGNKALAEQKATLPRSAEENEKELSDDGKTLVWVVDSGRLLGIIAVSDRIRNSASEAVSLLSSAGISSYILTGDTLASAARVAAATGADCAAAGVLPDEKAQRVKEISQGHGYTAMVGDGINDAPALASASVGIAMGSGTDIAVGTSDVVLMNNDLRSVAYAIMLSKKTSAIIRQNLFWALIYNCVGVLFAAGLFIPVIGIAASPELAAAAMSISSLCVVTNALRLGSFSPSRNSGNKERKRKEKMETTKRIAIKGMMCAHCAARVEKALAEISKAKVSVNLEGGYADVSLADDPGNEVLVSAVRSAGYEALSVTTL